MRWYSFLLNSFGESGYLYGDMDFDFFILYYVKNNNFRFIRDLYVKDKIR